MLNIQQEIVNIVLDQDFIVLPGIGAFMTEYSKPYFDKEGQIVLPEKRLEFNNLIDRDLDNKLLGLISIKANLPKELIKSDYNDFLNKFRSGIILEHKYEIENLGLFFKNESHELVFYPEKKNLGQEITPEQTIETTNNRFFVKPLEDYEKENADSEIDLIPENKRNYLKILLYLLPIFLITTTLAYTIFIKPHKAKSEKKNMVEEIDSLKNLQNETLNDSNLNTPESEKRNSDTKKKKETESQKEASVDSSNKNHIVGIGIFKVKENVDNLAAYLAENGIPARVRRYGDKYKLFVTANSEEQANDFVQKIEQLTGEKAVYENN